MKRFIHDDKNGLDYELVGDYYLPCLKVPEAPQLGRFGRMHYDYLRKSKRAVFDGLMLSGEMNEYIEGIDRQAEEMFSQLVKQLAENENVTERLKADNQMEWVRRMNSICNRAEEIVKSEVVFV